jgi:hypothetical protein
MATQRTINHIMADVENSYNEETGEMESNFDELQDELKDKIDGIGEYLIRKDFEIDTLKVMRDSYNERIKALTNKQNSFKLWLSKFVKVFGAEEKNKKGLWMRGAVVGLKHHVKQKLIVDYSLLPDDFTAHKIMLEFHDHKQADAFNCSKKYGKHIKSYTSFSDTKKIEDALTNGKEVNGASLKEVDSLSITGIKKLKESNTYYEFNHKEMAMDQAEN